MLMSDSLPDFPNVLLVRLDEGAMAKIQAITSREELATMNHQKNNSTL